MSDRVDANEAIIYTTTLLRMSFKKSHKPWLSTMEGKDFVFDVVENIWHEHGQTEKDFAFCLDRGIEGLVEANRGKMIFPNVNAMDIIKKYQWDGLLDKASMLAILQNVGDDNE